ncbi:MAG: hypothetical protein ACR2FU_15375 [Streptosporangiaceae bacterium]
MARSLALAAAAAAVLLTGCGSAQPAPRAHDAQVIVKRDAANGSTVRLAVGDKLELVLASSYWTFRGSSPPGVLRQTGPVQLLKTTRTCVPGGGCRPKRVIYRAIKAGRAVITAHRVSCGEALACTGSKRRFTLTVVVG